VGRIPSPPLGITTTATNDIDHDPLTITVNNADRARIPAAHQLIGCGGASKSW
jgi:hypothetical protein